VVLVPDRVRGDRALGQKKDPDDGQNDAGARPLHHFKYSSRGAPSKGFLGRASAGEHLLFFVDASVDPDPEQVFKATFHLSDANGVLADSQPFTLQFSIDPPCPADLNDDNEPDVFDFIAFQEAFQAGEAVADCDGNGAFDIFDYVCFQGTFQNGCP